VSERHQFETFEDLDRALREALGRQRYDAVIQAAAVSDFSVDPAGGAGPEAGKLASGEGCELRLSPNPKLLARIRSYAGAEPLQLVGFKLTVDADQAAVEEAVNRQFIQSGPDWVVHNDLRDIRAGQHRFTVYAPGDSGPRTLRTFEDSGALALGLSRLMSRERDLATAPTVTPREHTP
jgi:phosphopantothenoylcysteine synthetase/decarboxylase